MAFYWILWMLFLLLVLQINAQNTSTNGTLNIIAPGTIGAGSIPVTQQDYNWNQEYRCQLNAHGAAVLENDDHHYLVFDSGMAKFKYIWAGEDVNVLDLNGWTVLIDLSKPFNTQDFKLDSQTKRNISAGVPVLNRMGLWTDSTQNAIYVQGGHFYSSNGWDQSSFHVNKTEIPPYSIWKFDLTSKQWADVTDFGGGKENFTRAQAGAAVSVTGLNLSFYIGGMITATSDPEAPADLFTPQQGMIVYDHSTGNLVTKPYGTGEEQGYGYWHGALNYLQIGGGKGFLLSLMAERGDAGQTRPDAPGVNDETGISVAFDYVLFYDLEREAWYKQQTTFIDGDEPVTRTRFCGQTVYSNSTKTWEFWIYGGQLVNDKGEGVNDVYVLSMPSFVWTKVLIPGPENHIRSHSCHALGSQMLIVGGAPPGFSVAPDTDCTSELIKVFDMNNISWKSRYEVGTAYSTPSIVYSEAEVDGNGKRIPAYRKPWASTVLSDAFHHDFTNNTTPTPPPKHGPKIQPWGIALIVIAAVVVVCGIGAGVLWWKEKVTQVTPTSTPPPGFVPHRGVPVILQQANGSARELDAGQIHTPVQEEQEGQEGRRKFMA